MRYSSTLHPIEWPAIGAHSPISLISGRLCARNPWKHYQGDRTDKLKDSVYPRSRNSKLAKHHLSCRDCHEWYVSEGSKVPETQLLTKVVDEQHHDAIGIDVDQNWSPTPAHNWVIQKHETFSAYTFIIARPQQQEERVYQAIESRSRDLPSPYTCGSGFFWPDFKALQYRALMTDYLRLKHLIPLSNVSQKG